jgi:hypothetical protein
MNSLFWIVVAIEIGVLLAMFAGGRNSPWNGDDNDMD